MVRKSTVTADQSKLRSDLGFTWVRLGSSTTLQNEKLYVALAVTYPLLAQAPGSVLMLPPLPAAGPSSLGSELLQATPVRPSTMHKDEESVFEIMLNVIAGTSLLRSGLTREAYRGGGP